MDGWYYMHKNGALIYKRELGDTHADLRESDLVRGMWPFDSNDRETVWRIAVEAGAAGVAGARIRELADLWKLTDQDAQRYVETLGGELYMDGDQWCAVGPGFRDLQQDDAGFGTTALEALTELCKAVGYKPSKMWGDTFKSLLEARDPANGQFGVGA
jgi:hypothetical protein